MRMDIETRARKLLRYFGTLERNSLRTTRENAKRPFNSAQSVSTASNSRCTAVYCAGERRVFSQCIDGVSTTGGMSCRCIAASVLDGRSAPKQKQRLRSNVSNPSRRPSSAHKETIYKYIHVYLYLIIWIHRTSLIGELQKRFSERVVEEENIGIPDRCAQQHQARRTGVRRQRRKKNAKLLVILNNNDRRDTAAVRSSACLSFFSPHSPPANAPPFMRTIYRHVIQ